MNLRELLFLVLCTALFGACSHGDSERILRQAETVVQERPDSALVLLQSLDRHCLGSEREARYALLYTMAQDKSLVEVTSDSLLRIAYDYYRRHERDTLAARAYLYMGRFFILRDSTKQANECILRCVQLARQQHDDYTTYLGLYDLSTALTTSDARSALAYAQEAYRVFEEGCPPNIYNKVCLLKQIGVCYECLEQPDSALQCYENAIRIAREAGDNNALGIVYHDIAAMYLGLENYQEAFSYATKAWYMSDSHDEHLTLMMSECYLGVDSLDKAERLLRSLLHSDYDDVRYAAFYTLREIAIKKNNSDKIVVYSDSVQSCLDRLRVKAEKTNLAYVSELMQQKLDNERIVHDMWRHRHFNVSAFVLFVFFLLFFLHIYKSAKRNLSYEKEQRKISDCLREVEHKQRIAEESLYKEQIKRREDRISEMRTFLFAKIDIIKTLKKANGKNGKRIFLSEQEWTEIEFVLNESGKNFVDRLSKQYPFLSEKDIRLCMLLRLNIDNKTLEDVFLYSPQYIKQKQTILKKTMGINDSSLSLRQYLSVF